MSTLMDDLFRSGVRCAEAVPQLADEAMYPEERGYVRGAVPKRRAEFATARLLARRLLVTMGVPPVPLVPERDRVPRWPAGIVGSISHTHEYCAVAIARADEVCSVGLDVEALRAIDATLYPTIMSAGELAWLESQPVARRNELALLIFSAKEAYYKCQYTISGAFLDFLDVELEVAVQSAQFEARVLKPNWPSSVARLQGRFVFRSGKVLCGVELLA